MMEEKIYKDFIERHEHCQNELCQKDVEWAKAKLKTITLKGRKGAKNEI